MVESNETRDRKKSRCSIGANKSIWRLNWPNSELDENDTTIQTKKLNAKQQDTKLCPNPKPKPNNRQSVTKFSEIKWMRGEKRKCLINISHPKTSSEKFMRTSQTMSQPSQKKKSDNEDTMIEKKQQQEFMHLKLNRPVDGHITYWQRKISIKLLCTGACAEFNNIPLELQKRRRQQQLDPIAKFTCQRWKATLCRMHLDIRLKCKMN